MAMYHHPVTSSVPGDAYQSTEARNCLFPLLRAEDYFLPQFLPWRSVTWNVKLLSLQLVISQETGDYSFEDGVNRLNYIKALRQCCVNTLKHTLPTSAPLFPVLAFYLCLSSNSSSPSSFGLPISVTFFSHIPWARDFTKLISFCISLKPCGLVSSRVCFRGASVV